MFVDRLKTVIKQNKKKLSGSFTPVPEIISTDRMNICRSCEFLFKPTNSCKKCGCFMNVKTKMIHATCPIGKW